MSHARPNTDEAPAKALYTVAEFARIVGISERTAYYHIKNGDIEAKHLGRRIYVTALQLDRFLWGDPA